MRVAHIADVEWFTPSGHRGSGIQFKRLLAGTDGAPDNYELAVVRFPSLYTTPRHRHNYDQVRVGLEGSLNYAPGKHLGPGAIGYFPEGTSYGPQHVDTNPLAMAVQLGGASGQGFFGYDTLNAGFRELARLGQFTDGIWRGPDPRTGTVVNKDGYQAVWEHLAGREMRYAEPAYAEPVIMFPDGFGGPPDRSGCVVRPLGTFTAARTGLTSVRVVTGATFTTSPAPAGQLLFLLAGAVDAGTDVLGRHDAAHLDAGEDVELKASDDTELLVIDLPRIT